MRDGVPLWRQGTEAGIEARTREALEGETVSSRSSNGSRGGIDEMQLSAQSAVLRAHFAAEESFWR